MQTTARVDAAAIGDYVCIKASSINDGTFVGSFGWAGKLGDESSGRSNLCRRCIHVRRGFVVSLQFNKIINDSATRSGALLRARARLVLPSR